MDTRSKLVMSVIALVTGSIGCASSGEEGFRDLLKKSEIEDVNIRIDERIENSYCKSWHMTDSEIKQYFLLASVISGEERQLLYDWGGCNLEGRIKVENKNSFEFTINAGGTASVIMDGREVLYGCKTACNGLFDFGFYTDSED